MECPPKVRHGKEGTVLHRRTDVQAQVVTPCFQPCVQARDRQSDACWGEGACVSARAAVFQQDLYIWRDRFLSGGPEALRGPGRPRNSERSASRGGGGSSSPGAEGELDKAYRRIAALERKVGQQQVELD